jgi:large subunit ribosomal protein L3
MIKGAVPGSKGGWVTVKDAVKKPTPNDLPFPAALKSTIAEMTEPSSELTEGGSEQ